MCIYLSYLQLPTNFINWLFFFSISPQATLSLVVQVFSVTAVISGTGKDVVGAKGDLHPLPPLLGYTKSVKLTKNDFTCTEFMYSLRYRRLAKLLWHWIQVYSHNFWVRNGRDCTPTRKVYDSWLYAFDDFGIFSLKLGINILFPLGNMAQYLSSKQAKHPGMVGYLSNDNHKLLTFFHAMIYGNKKSSHKHINARQCTTSCAGSNRKLSVIHVNSEGSGVSAHLQSLDWAIVTEPKLHVRAQMSIFVSFMLAEKRVSTFALCGLSLRYVIKSHMLAQMAI